MTLPRRIGATYRVQLVPGHGFAEAAARLPYLAALGAETLYLSPVTEAVPGSRHGYDGTDPTQLRQELGGGDGFAALVEACDAHGLGILVDWVPNHLATWHRGRWWRQLLAEGRHSEIAPVFDVDWDAGRPGQRGKVALPILDRSLADALAAGAVRLGRRDGEPVILVGDVDLPLAEESRGAGPDGAGGPGGGVEEVLAAQHYRLVDWHEATDRNYRRFFDVDGLVGVRVEDPEVFSRTHALVLDLAAAGKVSGLRVDHVDGLREPAAYLRRLAAAAEVPLVVEKILTGDEELRPDWPVVGTTGYEVLDDIGGVLVDPDGQERLAAAGRADGDHGVGALTVQTRRLAGRVRFGAELGRAARRLGVGAGALTDTVARLPCYRTYLAPEPPGGPRPGEPDAGTGGQDPGRLHPADVEAWRAAAGANPGRQSVTRAVLDAAHRPAALSLQQVTGAVMAKGVEDTAWYRLSGPLAFCEVGGDPAADRHDAAARMLRRAAARAAGHAGLVPGTTHDTKRAEDVRCRLYALSELTHPFEEGLARLRVSLGLPGGGGELASETRVIAQLLLGFLPPLPPPGAPPGAPAPGDAAWPGDLLLAERLGGALRKGAREAGLRSSWRSPDEAYEARLCALAGAALADGAALTRHAFGGLVAEVARLGALCSLSSVVLRHALPGIPDCFEGSEAWTLSLVDPDNRRPVDTGALDSALVSLAAALDGDPGAVAAARRTWRDGRVKVLVTSCCLHAVRAAPEALAPGATPAWLAVSGPAAPSVLAVARRAGRRWALAVVTRRGRSLACAEGDLPAGASYAGTRVTLPPGAPTRWRDQLSGRTVEARGRALDAEAVLSLLPVALLTDEPARRRVSPV